MLNLMCILAVVGVSLSQMPPMVHSNIDVQCPDRAKSGICTLEYAPVCGSDGVTYPNECNFCYHKLNEKPDLEISYRGECKTATTLVQTDCSKYGDSGICTADYRPVCGSDGVTYGNECNFCYQKNHDKPDIVISHTGECAKPTNLVHFDHEARCPPHSGLGICTREYNPVCGTDGITYPNDCEFCYHKVTDRPDLHIHNRGACEHDKYGRTNLIKANCPPRSAHGMCTREYRPVCGTDGVSYPNECVFCWHQATDKADIELAHRGPCQKAASLIQAHCPPRSRQGMCTREYAPVCGTDGVTYSNECTFCWHQATDKKEIEIAYRGECQKDHSFMIEAHCSPRSASGICTREYMPVCGTDGITYPNECVFCYHKQTDKTEIDIAYRGECKKMEKFPLVWWTAPKCDEHSAKGMCNKMYKPVCGTDGETYPNECLLCYHKQNGNDDLMILYHGECKFGGQ